jgi:predicted nucleic acid-binding protein
VSGFVFDTAIVIDFLAGETSARREINRALSQGGRPWISRLTWLEILSQATTDCLRDVEAFLGGFSIDEVDEEIALRAAALRRERKELRLIDATVLATALSRGRVLVTRNTRDFPAEMPGIRIPYVL